MHRGPTTRNILRLLERVTTIFKGCRFKVALPTSNGQTYAISGGSTLSQKRSGTRFKQRNLCWCLVRESLRLCSSVLPASKALFINANCFKSQQMIMENID